MPEKKNLRGDSMDSNAENEIVIQKISDDSNENEEKED